MAETPEVTRLLISQQLVALVSPVEAKTSHKALEGFDRAKISNSIEAAKIDQRSTLVT